MNDKELATIVGATVAAVSRQMANPGGYQQMQRVDPSGAATPFGCCDFFDRCGDGDMMSLHYAGRLPLLDWMGFNVSDECYKVMEFISYVRPEYDEGTPSGGYISSPCDDPNSIEYGSCKITVEDFGRYGRLGPIRDIMKPKKYCLTDPVWRLDGTRVGSEKEWDMRFLMDQIIADVSKHLITGNATTGGQFDGLERWVKTGYSCSIIDSIVIDWNGNPMSGGNGITWNGNAVANTYNFVDVLLAGFRRIKQRITWNLRLATQTVNVGDMIIMLPNSMIDCLLDHYTCWSVCDGSQYNEVALQSYEARQFRNGLLGGMFGNGQITLDGQIIPILGYDWDLIKGPKTGDIYFLTGALGNFRVWDGEHINANVAVAEHGGQGYFSSDGGRVLWREDTDNECFTVKGWIHPRLFCRAPWMQIRFQDVQCDTPGGFISPDPTETSFFPLSSFSAAEC